MPGGRPTTKGLSWFKKDVNYYEDFKIFDLIENYGPLGNTVFDCLLCMIYREVYYLEISPEKLCLAVVKTIGGKWVKKHQVLQVIQYCADIDLLDKGLLARSVVTSAGIQRRYAEVTSRNKVDKSLYWLIDENGQPLKNIPFSGVSDAETRVFAAKTPVSDAEIPTREDKRRTDKRRERQAACAAAPTLDEVKGFFKGRPGNPERFWHYYGATGWTVHGEPVTNWRALAENWIRNERQKPEPEAAHTPSYDLEEYENFDIFEQKEKLI
mgnify:CR=1 FL=1